MRITRGEYEVDDLLLFVKIVSHHDNVVEEKIYNTSNTKNKIKEYQIDKNKKTKVHKRIKRFGMALAGIIGSAVMFGAMVLFRLMF